MLNLKKKLIKRNKNLFNLYFFMFKSIYEYKWLKNLIAYCSDPFNRFKTYKWDRDNLVLISQKIRLDRAAFVLQALSKYGKNNILERESFIENLVNDIVKDYDKSKENEFRSNIEKIINEN